MFHSDVCRCHWIWNTLWVSFAWDWIPYARLLVLIRKKNVDIYEQKTHNHSGYRSITKSLPNLNKSTYIGTLVMLPLVFKGTTHCSEEAELAPLKPATDLFLFVPLGIQTRDIRILACKQKCDTHSLRSLTGFKCPLKATATWSKMEEVLTVLTPFFPCSVLPSPTKSFDCKKKELKNILEKSNRYQDTAPSIF